MVLRFSTDAMKCVVNDVEVDGAESVIEKGVDVWDVVHRSPQ